jgi:hypothetical protein
MVKIEIKTVHTYEECTPARRLVYSSLRSPISIGALMLPYRPKELLQLTGILSKSWFSALHYNLLDRIPFQN